MRKSDGEIAVLHDIDIQVGDGDFLVLVGPSGYGKSSLLNMIAGLEDISGGAMQIDSQPINELAPKDRDIAMVFQSYALYPTMSVGDNIGFGLKMMKVPKKQREKRIAEVAKLLQIEDLLKRKPGQFSGGRRQRVAMGRAWVRDPKVFLFDEPLSNLDARLRAEMRTEIKKLHQRLGTTVVYVTNDQIEAMTMATRIAVMNKGYLQQLGSPREIYDFSVNTFVATFMSLDTLIAVEANDIPIPERADQVALSSNQEVLLGLRPEWTTAEALGAKSWSFEAEIVVAEPTGPNTMALFHLDSVEVTAALPGDADVKPGNLYSALRGSSTGSLVSVSIAALLPLPSLSANYVTSQQRQRNPGGPND